MDNRTPLGLVEHLLVLGGEEGSEVAVAALAVAKAFSKMLRFGPYDLHPSRHRSATEVLVAELNDLTAVVEMVQEVGVPLPGLGDREAIEAKKAKVRRMMEYSRECGLLEPTPPTPVADAPPG